MGKKFISIILIISTIFLFTSCNSVKNENATIQIWWYNYSNSGGYTNAIENVIRELEVYCDENSIPIEIVKYSEDTLAYDDYILKRNSAMANGNMITIDDARRLHEIEKYHADYSKVENYSKLFDVYKDRFCIPIGVGYQSNILNNEVLSYYGISTDRSIITYNDYLDIKQQIRENGGNFRLNKGEYKEIAEYYLIKNGLRYINEDSEIIKDSDKFKAAIKNAAIEMYDGFKLYYEDCNDFDFLYKEKMSDEDSIIYDINSELVFTNYRDAWYGVTDYNEYEKLRDQIFNMTFVIHDGIFNSPCIYMHKKISNDKIYDVFNKLLDESYYMIATTERFRAYAPVQNTDKIRGFLDVDENWNYNGELMELANKGYKNYVKLADLINETYELLVKNEETVNILASYYYYNWDYSWRIYNCINSIVNELIVSKVNYNTSEGAELINNSIDEFITNFNVHYN